MKSCFVYSTGVLSVLIIIAGIAMVLAHVFQNLLYNRIKKEVVLENGTDAFAVWKDPPPPVYMQFYFFNLTNPKEVLSGDKPAVIELGPYTYREYRPMEGVNFMDNGTKVAAINPKTYIFEPNMSRGSEDDIIRTVNIPAMTIMRKFQSPFFQRIISDLMISKNESLFGTWKVQELLWGYEDLVLKELQKLHHDLDPNFGLFYKMNGTGDGEYVFYTGKQNYQDFTRVDLWRGQSMLDWWTTDQCNMINGTNGATFHPIINKTEKLYMFSSDLCRSIYAIFESELSVRGVPAYRFVPPSEVFANTTINPDNAGFCVGGNCLSSGLLNVSVCKQGAPIIMSSPHFYQADKKFSDDVYGMRPKKEEHQTAIDINPLTGLVVQAAKRLQVNVFIEKLPAFRQTGDVRTLVYPVMYINESVLVDEDSAKKLQSVVNQANVVINVPFIIIGVGILLGIVFIVLMCRQERGTPEESQPLLSS
ncbi:lysosome membrane protein 2c [Tachysurus vachellii]|uniref:lysosome membrane protein 2c n=1 Tax=Tachysurus vachellii TaxID=175792 RepID=UPI00296B3B45|nr:lysosome membrane protein 2c [Tachysurus vachellii]